MQVFQFHRCDTTIEIDCEDGDEECVDRGKTSRMRFSNLRGSVADTILVDLKGAANNPCFRGSLEIDYEGTLRINIGLRTVRFDGLIDGFPAFEMYATANDGAGVQVLVAPIPKGNTLKNLLGPANRPISGQANLV